MSHFEPGNIITLAAIQSKENNKHEQSNYNVHTYIPHLMS